MKERAEATHKGALRLMTMWGLEDLLGRRGIEDATKGFMIRNSLRSLYDTMVKKEPQVCLPPDLEARVVAMMAIGAEATGTLAKRKASPATPGKAAKRKGSGLLTPEPSCSQEMGA